MSQSVNMTASDSFSIDDAFQSDEEANVRVYGSTRDSSASSPKVRPVLLQEEDGYIEGRKSGAKSTSHLLPASSTHSLRSDSGDTHVSTRSCSSLSSSWLQHPKIRENWRVVLGAFLLTMIGAGLFLTGLGIVVSPQRGMHCIVFFIGGLLCLIPGAYHLVYIYLAVKGYEGYSLYNLPVFN